MICRQTVNILARNTFNSTTHHYLSSNKDQRLFDLLYGVNPVQAAVHAQKRQIISLMVSDSEHIELSSRLAKLIHLVRSKNIPILFSPKEKMSRIVDYQPHQNVILKCSPIPLINWDYSQKFPEGISIFCDKITDPQNFGAVLRSALFFGAAAVFTGKKHHCPLNTTVSKTSSGAMELMRIYGVGNGIDFMQKWKQSGGIVVSTGVDEGKPHTPANEIGQVVRKERGKRVLLILGSEGVGVSPHLISASDYTVAIERKGPNEYPYNIIDSLNVSAAASTLLFELTR